LLEEELKKRTDNADEILSALDELYSLYSNKIATWLGSLYDPDIGGFYYSNSAKATYGYLPDLESTSQAFNFMKISGMISSYDQLPTWMKEKTEYYTRYLQDPESGFFYHLQWSRELINTSPSRLARDKESAHLIASFFGFELDKSADILKKSVTSLKDSDDLPPHLISKDAFREYLESFDWKTETYRATSTLVSQFGLLQARDLVSTAIAFIDKLQNPRTGLFESEDSPTVADSYFTASMFYLAAKHPLKYAQRAIPTILKRLDGKALDSATYPHHVWASVRNIIQTLRATDNEQCKKDADEIVAELMKQAPYMIRKTTELISEFQKPDGSFSYCKDTSAPFSQGMPVAMLGTNEGDVNATIICSTGTTRAIFKALELYQFYPPILGKDALDDFLSALKLPRELRNKENAKQN
jgi:hypothetical protein